MAGIRAPTENELSMVKKKILVILLLSAFQSGCAMFGNDQKPAPGQSRVLGTEYPPKTVQRPVKTQPYQVPEKIITQPIQSEVKPVTASPAVVALMSDANRSSKEGNLDAAVATVERALRIEPRNATLVYNLAELRLKQEKPRLAEDLAKKAILLSANDTGLKKRSWLLVSEARKMQGNQHGAAEAKKKAAQY